MKRYEFHLEPYKRKAECHESSLPLVDQFNQLGADGWLPVIEGHGFYGMLYAREIEPADSPEVAALKKRIDELLAANNDEVEKRREAERLAADRAGIIAKLTGVPVLSETAKAICVRCDRSAPEWLDEKGNVETTKCRICNGPLSLMYLQLVSCFCGCELKIHQLCPVHSPLIGKGPPRCLCNVSLRGMVNPLCPVHHIQETKPHE